MPNTVDYGKNSSVDLKLFGVLVAGFTIWSVSSTYFGLITLMLGINFTVLTEPSYNKLVDLTVENLEQIVEPITSKNLWVKIRPLAYSMLSASLSIFAYLVSF